MDQVDKITVNASKRELLGKKVKQLRAEGMIPAVLYGRSIEPTPIQIEALSLTSAMKEARGNRLIEIQIGKDGPHTVLVRDIQHDVITQKILHADFYEVIMTERITAEIPLALRGEAPAVRRGEGMLLTELSSVTVECLPGDLPEEIEVDLGGLEEVDHSIFIGDLRLSDDVRVLTDPEDLIVKVLPLREEEIIEEEVEVEEEAELVDEEGEIAEEGEAEEGEGSPEES